MSTSYKILGQAYVGLTQYEVPGGGSGYGYYYGGGSETSYNEELLPVTVYTVPAATQVVITSIFVSNHDVIDRTYDLAVVPSSESLSVKHHIRWDHPILAHDFDLISSKLSLSSGDSVVILPSAADKIGITIFGLELS